MASRDEIIAFANGYLELASYPDYGPMGLQVVGTQDVGTIACGVSASRELFEQAAAVGAQLILVHHGLFWDRDSRVIDAVQRGRLQALLGADMTLAAYHLALDAHPEIGNNALLCRALGIRAEERFAEVGFGGQLEEPCSIDELEARVERELGRQPLCFPAGPALIERAAVCSGAAARYLKDAGALGYDCFLTGEPSEPSLALASEQGIHFLAAGHYATETLGVQALAALLADRFSLAWKFLDIPNPV